MDSRLKLDIPAIGRLQQTKNGPKNGQEKSCPLYLRGPAGLFCAQLRVEIDDLYSHVLHGHARHDVVLCVRDQHVERTLQLAVGLFLQELFGLELVRLQEVLVGIL